MKFNVIGGTPRSGSTLLCNLLNQNPSFFASSTSAVPNLVGSMVGTWSNSIEIKNELNLDRVATEEKCTRSVRAFIEAWYKIPGKEVIFDKSRAWNYNALMFGDIAPEGKMIICVRDPRAVFASCEKQHRKNPLFDDSVNARGRTLAGRADIFFGEAGLIGGPMRGVEDLIRRKPKDVIFVRYENFIANPKAVMDDLHQQLGLETFAYDFDNVKDTSNDPDGFYLWKFPHEGSGSIKQQDTSSWRSLVSEDIAKGIIKMFPIFTSTFNYL
jgi:sulfotransferase